MGDDGWFVGGLDQNGVVFWFYNWGANNTVVLYLWILGKSKRINKFLIFHNFHKYEFFW